MARKTLSLAERLLKLKPVELLEFYNRMLDVQGVPDADGDVYERDDG